jgi:excisionase family DNA binding protein
VPKKRRNSPPKISVAIGVPGLPEPLLLDIPAAARALSTTVWAIRDLLWSNKIPYLKLGKKFLIDPADLRAFIAAQKAGA